MVPGQRVAGGMLAVLMATGSLVLSPRTTLALPQQLAQVTPGSVTGQLDETSQIIEGGYYFTSHPYEGTAGAIVTFELVSEDFDAVVGLDSPSRELLGSDDDSGDGTNARFTIELPETGTYQVGVVSYISGEGGQYTLSWRAASVADQELQRATRLEQQAGEHYQQERHEEAELLYQESLAIYREQLGVNHLDVATILNNLALVYEAQEHYEEAEPLYQESLAIYREQLGERHPAVANILNNLAFLYDIQGRYGEAEPLYQEALSIRHEQFGERHPDVAESLNDLAGLYSAQGRYGEAEPLYQEALSIRREQLEERHPDVAESLNDLALLYSAQGRYGEAEPLYQEALDIAREQLGERHPNVAATLDNLALLYRAQGRYEEADPLHQEALTIRRERLGERHSDVATSLNNLAVLRSTQGRYGEAERLYQEALSIVREQLGERHPDVAVGLNNLALLYDTQGRYEEVEPLYQEALDIYREQFGERHPSVATSLHNLAGLYRAQGRYGEAERLYQEALDIYYEQLGNRHPLVADSLNNLAGLYRAQGRYGEAERLYQEALSIRREQLGERHSAVAGSLNNLAGLYEDQGRYEEVEFLYQEALAIYREQFGESHPLVATSLNNLALLYRSQERYGEAEPLSQEALTLYREQFGERHPDVARSLNNLAALYEDQGRSGEAEPLYQEALAIYREQLGERHPFVATVLSNLTTLYEMQGETAQAIRTFQAGLAIEERHLESNLTVLTEAQRQDYVATLAPSTDWAIALSLQSAAARPLGLTTLLRRKGRLLEAGTSSLQRLRQNLTPEDQAVLDELVAARQQLAALTFSPPANLLPEQYQAQLAQLETTAADLEKTLAQRSALFRAEAEPVEIAAVQAQIPTDGVLVEYVRYYPVDDRGDREIDPHYAAYLLFPDGRIEAIDLGDAAAIDAAVQDFSGLLRSPYTHLQTPPSREAVPDRDAAIAATIRTLILDPIAPYLDDREHLLISPDSQLNRIPFEALQTEDEGRYLIERYQISYLSSGRDLLKFNLAEPSTAPSLLLANPDYTAANNTPQPAPTNPTLPSYARNRGENRRSLELGELQFGPLPGTAAEAEAIAPLLPNATILTEDQATENVLKTVAAPRILHIATHGFFFANVEPAPPNSRGLTIELDEASSLNTSPGGIGVENPLLRSGLALAGFNARSSGSEDGVLTALEAANLNLSGTQLVVLSACDTGLGDVVNGEGVYGLRRSFAIAGAETQLMSLWLVSDDGTQALMARYYENLMGGMGRSEALRATQLEMINEQEQYSHPYYWASFILAGDWRPLD